MIRFFSLLAIALLFCGYSYSQITITSSDLPQAGTNYVFSQSFDLNVDYITSGANQTWDFSGLMMGSQKVDSLYTLSQTNFAYEFFFNNAVFYPDYMADYGKKGEGMEFPGLLTIEETFNFFNTTSGEYLNLGYGAKINGMPIPVTNDPIDTIFRLPLNFNDHDSSYSVTALSFPSLGYFSSKVNREYIVDGYGTVITPYKSYQAIRVKTTLKTIDSVYSDQFGIGWNLDLPTKNEYAWFAKGEGEAILKITTIEIGGMEVVVGVEFKDELRVGLRGIAGLVDYKLFPVPASEELNVQSGEIIQSIKIIDALGKEINRIYPNRKQVKIDLSSYSKGIYLISLESGEQIDVKRFVIE